jgi:hypothetical protein
MNLKTKLKRWTESLHGPLCTILLFFLSAINLHAVQPAVAAGHRFSLFLKSDGTAWGCGYNVNGQIGVGDSVPIKTSTPNFIMGGVKAIAAGSEHSLFLMAGGTVMACGNNILRFWCGNDSVHDHAYFKTFPEGAPNGKGVEIVIGDAARLAARWLLSTFPAMDFWMVAGTAGDEWADNAVLGTTTIPGY